MKSQIKIKIKINNKCWEWFLQVKKKELKI